MRTLVVDDSLRIRQYLVSLVSRISEADEAADGAAAIGMMEAALGEGAPYDLILLDIGMPGMDGLSALDAVRKVERTRGIPTGQGARIVMVTAMVEPMYIMSAFRSQCEAYLPKPFTEEQFWGVLRDVGIETTKAA